MKRLPLLLLVLAALALTGCARATTQASEVSVNTEGHIVFPTNPDVNGCTAPERSDYLGAGDKHSIYPAGLRNYVFDSDQGSDHGPIPLTTSDDATMGLVGYITFRLVAPRGEAGQESADTKACEVLKRFHREIGSKTYNGHQGFVNDGEFRGWDGLLDQIMGKPAESVVADLGSDYKALAVYKDADVRTTIEDTIRENLPAKVKEATGGGAYFQIVTVSLSKPEPPPDLVKALNDGTVATQENANALLRNTTANTQFDQITACTDKGISETNCVLLYGINEGNVPVLQQGVGVTLPGGGAPKGQ